MTSKMLKTGWLLGILITLHTPSGREVFVNADEVMMIGASGGWNVGGCATEVLVHDKMICVVEPPFIVKKLVEGAK